MTVTFTPTGVDKTTSLHSSEIGTCDLIHNLRKKGTHLESIAAHLTTFIDRTLSPATGDYTKLGIIKKVLFYKELNIYILVRDRSLAALYTDKLGDKKYIYISVPSGEKIKDADLMGTMVIVQTSKTLRYYSFTFKEDTFVWKDTSIPQIGFEYFFNWATVDTFVYNATSIDESAVAMKIAERQGENKFYGMYIIQAFTRSSDNEHIGSSQPILINAGHVKELRYYNYLELITNEIHYSIKFTSTDFETLRNLNTLGLFKDVVFTITNRVMPIDFSKKDGYLDANKDFKENLFNGNTQYIVKEYSLDDFRYDAKWDQYYIGEKKGDGYEMVQNDWFKDDKLPTYDVLKIDYPISKELMCDSLKTLDNRLHMLQFSTNVDNFPSRINISDVSLLQKGVLAENGIFEDYTNLYTRVTAANKEWYMPFLKYMYDNGKYCFFMFEGGYRFAFSPHTEDRKEYGSGTLPTYNDFTPETTVFHTTDNIQTFQHEVILSLEFEDGSVQEEYRTCKVVRGINEFSTGMSRKQETGINIAEKVTTRKQNMPTIGASVLFSEGVFPSKSISWEDFYKNGLNMLDVIHTPEPDPGDSSLSFKNYGTSRYDYLDFFLLPCTLYFNTTKKIKSVIVYRLDRRPLFMYRNICTMTYQTIVSSANVVFGETKVIGEYNNHSFDCYNMAVAIRHTIEEYDYDNPQRKELASINVENMDANRLQISEYGNPFVFRAKNSYRFGNKGSKLLDILPVTTQLSEGKFGEHTLYAFSEEGIFTTSRGATSDVLFESIFKFSDFSLSDKGSISQTPKGVTFTTKHGIYILAGREIIEISKKLKRDQLSNMIPQRVENNAPTPTDICTIDTDKTLKNIVEGNVFSFYDQYHDEIIFMDTTMQENNIALIFDISQNLWTSRSFKQVASAGKVIGLTDRFWTLDKNSSEYYIIEHQIGILGTTPEHLNYNKALQHVELVSRPIYMNGITRIEQMQNKIYAKADGSKNDCGLFYIYGSTNGVSFSMLNGYFLKTNNGQPKIFGCQLLRRIPCSCIYYIIHIKYELEYYIFDGVDIEVESRFSGKLR